MSLPHSKDPYKILKTLELLLAFNEYYFIEIDAMLQRPGSLLLTPHKVYGYRIRVVGGWIYVTVPVEKHDRVRRKCIKTRFEFRDLRALINERVTILEHQDATA